MEPDPPSTNACETRTCQFIRGNCTLRSCCGWTEGAPPYIYFVRNQVLLSYYIVIQHQLIILITYDSYLSLFNVMILNLSININTQSATLTNNICVFIFLDMICILSSFILGLL